MASLRPQVVSIHNVLVSASQTTKKVVTQLAHCMLVNTRQESMDFLTIFYDLDDCASNSSEPS